MSEETNHSQEKNSSAANTAVMPRRYQNALAGCSRTLLSDAHTAEQRQDLLKRALSFLGECAQAGRSYVIQDFVDGEEILCMRLHAEWCAAGVSSHLAVPTNQHIPWTLVGLEIRESLCRGETNGGPTAELFAAKPDLVKLFHNQKDPLLSALMLPLFVDNVFWGFIGMDDVQQPRYWTEDEILVLYTAAEIFSSTLHRWELADRLRHQTALEATLAERQRLAQGLHDVITQRLYSLALMAQAGRESLREADVDALADSLDGIVENAILAQREMRVLLYQLGPQAVPTSHGLTAVLEDRLRRIERRLGLQTELRIDPTIYLRPEVVEPLYYVITEALNNSLQHAEATRVSVALVRSGDKLLLTLQDDGRGFRSGRLEPGMGLTQIAHRARELNAELAIDANSGTGTRIVLHLPPDVEGVLNGE